jgi:uncharacterized membrane protein HdeD (DUF308 family)
MTEILERRRTWGDVVLGVVLVIGGLVLLGNVVMATAVSVTLMAWSALIAGVLLVVGGLLQIGSGFSWSVVLGGAALAVLGMFMLRNLAAAAIALTLTAGALFLATGLARIGLAISLGSRRWLLVLSGIVSVVLGLWILVNPGAASFTLLGAMLGIQVLVEGVTLLLQGRLRYADPDVGGPALP